MQIRSTADAITANDEQYGRILARCRKKYKGSVLKTIEKHLEENSALNLATWNDLMDIVGGIAGEDIWTGERK